MRREAVFAVLCVAMSSQALAEPVKSSSASAGAPSEPGTVMRIPNADLEEGTTGPARWRFGHSAGSTGAWTWDTENRHSGQRAFRVRKENAEGYSTLLSDFFPVEAGKEYELSAWVKLHRRAPAGIYLMLMQYGGDSDTEQGPKTFGDFRRQFPEGEWQQVSVRFKAPEGITRVRAQGMVAKAPCEVTWDSFSLAPVTDKAADAPKAQSAEAPKAQSAVPAATESASSLPLRNADLETGTSSPAGWRLGHSAGSTGSWSWDTENVHSGQRAFRIRKENAEGYTTLTSDFLPVEAGKEYEVSAWVKVHEATTAGAYLMVSQYAAESDAAQSPNIFGDFRRRLPAGEWQRVTLRFTVRESAARVRIHAMVNRAACDVTWDSFSVAPVGP